MAIYSSSPVPTSPAATDGAATLPATGISGLHLLLDLPAAAVGNSLVSALGQVAGTKRPLIRKLRRVFWDTPDHRLGRSGFAAAIQTAGQRRRQWLFDIRQRPAGGRVNTPRQSPLTDDRLDLARLAFLPGADSMLAARLTADRLIPIFAVDLHRTVWHLAWGDTKLAVALEKSVVDASAGSREFCQLDIELLEGPAQGAYGFAQHLHATVPLTLPRLDPIQEAYALVTGEDWWPAATEAELRQDMDLRQGVLAIGRAATAALRQQVGALDHQLDPDQIHQTRVAFRRLRSFLVVFGPALPPTARKALGRDLAGIATVLGRVREWDVFQSETLGPLTAAMDEDVGLMRLGLTATVLRDEAARAARALLAGPTVTTLSLRLGAWFDAGIWPEPSSAEAAAMLDRPLAEFAHDLLRKRHKKLLAAAAALADPRPTELHALRIDAKKLRYTAEFFRTLFPLRHSRRYIAALRDLQEILGRSNDAAVARTLVSQLVKSEPGIGARAAGMITGWTAAEIAAEYRRFGKAWRGFARTRRFWKDG